MIYKALLFLFCSILPQISFLQDNKQNNYRSPLDIPLVLAANFGELRPNHFHMGVDFKTNGVEGLSLHSVEQGYVSRVKVSPYGYGKVVYIAHPNGMTSVYAHCSSFKGKLDSIVKKVQNEEQNFEIEIYFTPSDIPVKKGEIIALSGNTGGSTAPHLHFEIRETATDVAVNPLLYGFKIADSKAPEIRAVKVYALTEEGYQIPGKSKVYPITSGKQGPRLPNNEIIVPSDYCLASGGIGFSFDVIDYYDAALNVCGLYGSTLRSGKDTVFCQKIDQVSFEDSRYVNSHKDYLEYTTSKKKFHKSFKSENNPLTIYPSKHLGVIKAKPGDSLHLTYSVFDVKGNETDLQFSLKIQNGAMNKSTTIFPSDKYFLPDSSYFFQNNKIEISASELTFYEPVKKNLSLKEPFSFGDPSQPIQNPLTVKMAFPSNYLPNSKYYISVQSAGQRTIALDSEVDGNQVIASSYYLGTFRLKVDTLAPSIEPLNFKSGSIPTKTNRLSWKCVEYQTDLVDYDLFIDGKWYLLEYESKGDYLFFNKPKNLTGTHKVEIIVKDSCGNQRKWSKELSFL